MLVTTGNSGKRIRSDCQITLEIKQNGDIDIDLISKVKTLYGKSIIKLINDILRFFDIRNAKVNVIDTGALDFVIAARMEAAIKKLIKTDLEYLPELIKENQYTTSRDRFRFSRLYLPGNTPSMMLNAGLHSADGVILDLEDSVAPDKKEEARILVRNALRQVNFMGAERMVRINQGNQGLTDLRAVIPHNVNLVLIPKCESAGEVRNIDSEISAILKKTGIKRNVFLMPIVESALGIENSFSIASATPNVVALAIGLEDLTADLGVRRTKEGMESQYARSRLVIAAKAASVQPIDSVFSDVGDMEGLKHNVVNSKAMGFEGMGCIHPRQVALIREGFAPDEEEIDKSKKIVIAYADARSKGHGVVALGSKMIDAPVVARAQKTIDLAVKLGRLSKNWIKEISAQESQ